MDCRTAQNMITAFIKGELPDNTAMSFAEHVIGCTECKDELEVNYCLLTAILQLSGEQELSSDFISELDRKLELVIKKGKQDKKRVQMKRMLILLEIAIICLILL